MSAGERKYSTSTVEVKEREFPLRTEGDRDFRLLGDTVEIAQPNGGGVTYVKARAESLDPDQPKGLAFLNFFLDTRPDKQGQISFQGPNGIFALSKMIGDDLECGDTTITVPIKDSAGNPTGQIEDVLILDPEAVKAYLKAHDGVTVRGHEFVQKPSAKAKAKGYNKDQNVIDRWIIPERTADGQAETAPVEGTSTEPGAPPKRKGPPPPRQR